MSGDEIRINRLAELLNGAYTGNPNITRQGARAGVGQRTDRFSGPALGLLGGLMGIAPDEQSGSVLDPNSARNSPIASNIGFGLGTAMQMLPAAELAARGINAGAAKIGGLLGPSVDRAVTSTLNRGGLSANVLQDLAQGTQSNVSLWHGGTVKNKFSPSNDLNWFSENKLFADKFAEYSKGATQKFDVPIKNPIDATKYGDKEFTLKAWKNKLEKLGVDVSGVQLNDWAPDYGRYTFYDLFPHAGNNYKGSNGLIDALKKSGYDGIANFETTDGIKSKVFATFGDPGITPMR